MQKSFDEEFRAALDAIDLDSVPEPELDMAEEEEVAKDFEKIGPLSASTKRIWGLLRDIEEQYETAGNIGLQIAIERPESYGLEEWTGRAQAQIARLSVMKDKYIAVAKMFWASVVNEYHQAVQRKLLISKGFILWGGTKMDVCPKHLRSKLIALAQASDDDEDDEDDD